MGDECRARAGEDSLAFRLFLASSHRSRDTIVLACRVTFPHDTTTSVTISQHIGRL